MKIEMLCLFIRAQWTDLKIIYIIETKGCVCVVCIYIENTHPSLVKKRYLSLDFAFYVLFLFKCLFLNYRDYKE